MAAARASCPICRCRKSRTAAGGTNTNSLPIMIGRPSGRGRLHPVWYASIFVVNEREQAIVVRFGEIQDVKTEPGLYFKASFRLRRFRYGADHRGPRAAPRSRRPAAGAGFRRPFYEVDAFLTYKITDARRFRETVSGDLVSAESRLRTRFDAALRRLRSALVRSSLVGRTHLEMMREVRDLLRPEAQSLGLRSMTCASCAPT
jgi:membrane protease subunit HflC